MVENPPAKKEMWVHFLGQGGPLEQEMATHSSVLAWTVLDNSIRKRVRLQSLGLQSHTQLSMHT